MVLMICLESSFHKRRVLSLILPALGFKIESGTIKSEVRMIFLFQSTVRPWGLKLSVMMFKVPALSSGNWWRMLPCLSVSTRRPGDVPAAAETHQWLNREPGWCHSQPIYVMRKPLRFMSALLQFNPTIQTMADSPIRLCADFICYGGKQCTIAFLKCRPVRIGDIKVKRSVLNCVRCQIGKEVCHAVPGFSKAKVVHLRQGSFHLAKTPSDEDCFHL